MDTLERDDCAGEIRPLAYSSIQNDFMGCEIGLNYMDFKSCTGEHIDFFLLVLDSKSFLPKGMFSFMSNLYFMPKL